jgi:hypothetical protein
MQTRRWLNPTQPQTLQIAVFLLYINAAFLVLYGAIYTGLGLLIGAAYVAGGYGIANERKWGYGLGVGVSVLPFVIRLIARSPLVGGDILNFMFEVALVALLLHPQSRDYQRIWFK